jgi:CheY-like chemotaxis protein
MNDLKNQATVFVVDDDDVDVMTVQRCFKKKNISNPIVRAKDGIEALEMFRAGAVKSPYLILLDLKMPRMGGLEFLTEIRNDDKLKASLVFVMSTSNNDQDILNAYINSAAGYLLKDGSTHEFSKIANVLRDYWNILQLPPHTLI